MSSSEVRCLYLGRMPTVASPKRKTSRPPIQEKVAPPPPPPPVDRSVRVYAAPVLLSAFLLFLVQPMLAKAILPWFGGVAGVWIVAMLFFQGMLVVGYSYAYLLTRFLAPRLQPVCHVALLLGSLLLMPISPWRMFHADAAADPSLQILSILFLSVGLPYFLLSTTGPLIQAWYSQAQRVAFPYRLFALSNLGSLLALLAYPVTIEPILTTRHQMAAWSVLYGAFVLLASFTAFRYWRSHPAAASHNVAISEEAIPAPSRSEYVFWAALAACGSALLVTVMNHLCQNVAPIPLLWVLPLGVYLLTFILCFDRQGWYKPGLFRLILPIALGTMYYGAFHDLELGAAKTQIIIYLVCLFVGCMFCHGELARRKPHSRYLTSFYLMLSLGGALASIAIGLVAPRVSTWQVEFPIVLLICAILSVLALYPKHWARWIPIVALVGIMVTLAAGLLQLQKKGLILKARSFYGSLTVVEKEASMQGYTLGIRALVHGTIKHGTEFIGLGLENVPTSYYAMKSGVGLLLSAPREAWNVGVVGLGAGTLAAYGQPGDAFTFYEIDPLVADVAQKQFRYLSTSKAAVKLAIGDGRLSLEKEPAQKFDLLVIDAFSGDSIPAHLLTREAFEMYFSKLKPNGVVAVHISNRFISLSPLLAVVADDLGKTAKLVQNKDNDPVGAVEAVWALMANDPYSLRNLPVEPSMPLSRRTMSKATQGLDMWTDDYSNVFRLLK